MATTSVSSSSRSTPHRRPNRCCASPTCTALSPATTQTRASPHVDALRRGRPVDNDRGLPLTRGAGMGALEGKVVIVTGAAQGMGRSHARRCVEEGALVTMTDIRTDLPDDLQSLVGDRLQFVQQDVSSADDWERV